MRFIYPNLVRLMHERGMGYKDLAGVLSISEYAAYRRLRGFSGWRWNETIQLCQHFDVTDAAWLFKLCDEATVSQKF